MGNKCGSHLQDGQQALPVSDDGVHLGAERLLSLDNVLLALSTQACRHLNKASQVTHGWDPCRHLNESSQATILDDAMLSGEARKEKETVHPWRSPGI